jgi:hypothetical protein
MSDNPTEVDEQKVLGSDSTATPASKSDKEKAQAVEEYSKQEDNGELSMRVKVYSPFNDYYEGQAFSLSAENATGPFDVLPKHHNFISLLNACEVIVRSVNKGEQRIQISGGIMHVKADQVIIFLDV